MARIIKQIEIEGKKATALFDTGAYHTYVCRQFVSEVPKRIVPKPYTLALGGREIKIHEECIAVGKIEGLSFTAKAVPIDKLKKADGYELDAIIGTLTMEEWEIKLDPKTGKLDLEGLRKREFTEFFEQIIHTIKVLWKKGKGQVSLDEVGGERQLGYLYGESGFLGKDLKELIEKAKKDMERGKFFLENLKEIKGAISKANLKNEIE